MDFRLDIEGIRDDETYWLLTGWPTSTGEAAIEANPDLKVIEGDVNDYVSNSQRSTPFEPHTTDAVYLGLLAILGNPNRGYTFGLKPGTDFRLPKIKGKRGLSGLQFQAKLNQHGAMMVIDESTNGTSVNDRRLRSPQGQRKIAQVGRSSTLENIVALHPQKPNKIEVGDLTFTLYVIVIPDPRSRVFSSSETLLLSYFLLESLPSTSVMTTDTCLTQMHDGEYHIISQKKRLLPQIEQKSGE